MDLRNVAEYLQGICNCGIQQIRNRHRVVPDCQRLTVVTPAMADFTGHVDIRQETHFEFAKTIPLTRIASPACDIDAKTTSFVPPPASVCEHRVQLANACVDARAPHT